MEVEKARTYILEELRNRLGPDLYYHGLHHTLDVTTAALEIAALEGITDSESLQLLETAALYHDSGFMNVYKGHEMEGCRIAREVLSDYKYSEEQIEQICGMITATRIPQSPMNLLERIICDADLDYLGRDDFEPVSATLFDELKARDLVNEISEWNKTQLQFFDSHFYWTKSQQARRNEGKAKHLSHLKQIAGS